MNLVVNARDAMPGGGRIDIATRTSPCAAGSHPPELAPGDYVVLTVTDTGAGMSAETRQQIFEPFFSTKGEAGTGLGLSTVYGIVRQRQGAIDVWSEPGRAAVPHLFAAARHGPEPGRRRRARAGAVGAGAFSWWKTRTTCADSPPRCCARPVIR